MGKNVIEDIVSSKRVEKRDAFFNRKAEEAGLRHDTQREESVSTRGSRKRVASKFYWYIGVFIIFVLLILFVLSVKGGVELLVIPRSEILSVDVVGRASKVADTGEVSFKILSIEKIDTKELKSSGTREVDRRASGKIIVYNNHSTESQRLIARTRFKTTEGLVYRVPDPIIIPGAKVIGGERIPGSIEITVNADEPGEEYNIALSDFNLPGLEGSLLFNNIYARSKTEMRGGFSGMIQTVSDDDLSQARTEMSDKLRKSILSDAKSGLSGNQITFEEVQSLKFREEILNMDDKDSGKVEFMMTAMLDMVIFNKDDISKFVVESFDVKDSVGVSIDNLPELSFDVTSINPIDILNVEDFGFELSGGARLIWPVPENEIKNALLGINKDESMYKQVFSLQFPNIKEARVTRWSPFWSRKFPKKADKIEIISGTDEN